MDPSHRMEADAERARYDAHHNEPGDLKYRAWLDRLAVPLAAKLAPGAEGLDFGCGPGPVLAQMLAQRGFGVALYDPFYAPDPEGRVLGRGYDFVTCTEAAEHFYEPLKELALLDRLLRPGGWLGLMTDLVRPEVPFGQWHYPRDPTHVCFYRPATLAWAAARFGWEAPESPTRNVFLFHKPASPAPAPAVPTDAATTSPLPSAPTPASCAAHTGTNDSPPSQPPASPSQPPASPQPAPSQPPASPQPAGPAKRRASC
ncbi:putative class I SAM-dependent methyltransferase [Paratrimastix pyriformis]|uniref:Class I SAM-dependent methyltransferase n=1 Tax=Paratrimastix pyriformis TaxID=342808 RepID=A0ABQ8UKG4_9EUKA|nr:putative class I SAM-dependent methyltransferase [Paratrimastix pyriformis]